MYGERVWDTCIKYLYREGERMKIILSTRESFVTLLSAVIVILRGWDWTALCTRGSWPEWQLWQCSGDCLSTKSSGQEKSWEDAWGGKGRGDLCFLRQSWRQKVHCVPLGDLLQPQMSEEGLGPTQATVCASHGPEDRTQGQWSSSLKRF